MKKILHLKKILPNDNPIRISITVGNLINHKFQFFETKNNYEFEFNEIVSLNGNILTKNIGYNIIKKIELNCFIYYIELLNFTSGSESSKIEFLSIPIKLI
jgi:uncharacterized protein YxjI